MLDGRRRFVTFRKLLVSTVLLGLWLHDADASHCPRVFQKQVGDTVELLSCLPADGVIMASWRCGDKIVADISESEFVDDPFFRRSYINPTNFSLTLANLTLNDSGEFKFLSATKTKQRETIIIRLVVHERFTPPILNVLSTWNATYSSCLLSLECSSTFAGKVVWSIGNQTQTQNGTRLQYIITPQEEETTFTCTVSNPVSQKSVSRTLRCDSEDNTGPDFLFWILLSVAVGCLIIIAAVIAVALYCVRRRRDAASDLCDNTVYADITDVAAERPQWTSTSPNSLYDTVDDNVNQKPHSVYDTVQLSRMRTPSVSPYQEIREISM